MRYEFTRCRQMGGSVCAYSISRKSRNAICALRGEVVRNLHSREARPLDIFHGVNMKMRL